MDVFDYFKQGGVQTIPNPEYNPKNKNNTEPQYIETPYHTEQTEAMKLANYGDTHSYSVDANVAKKYEDYGLNWTPWADNLDLQLADAQSGFEKFRHSVAQTLVSEIGLGTLKGASDLFDFIGSAVGLSDGDYSNPVSAKLEQWQEDFRNWTPIYSDPNKHLSNGGLLDMGWWASNIPSIASSLTLLIPSTGVVKGLQLLGKATKFGALTRNAVRTVSLANRTVRKGKELNAVQRFLVSPSTQNTATLFFENGTTAALSRAMENYQEARQTYSDTYSNNLDYINNMSPEQYERFLNENKDLLKEKNITDTSNRQETLKAVAEAAADRTFQMNWNNVVFDVIQVYALRNAWKGFGGESPIGSSTVRRAYKNQAKYWGKTPEEIEKLKAARPMKEKVGEWILDKTWYSKGIIGAELSEGVEEAVNYVAQQEGMHLGNVLLGSEKGSRAMGWGTSISLLYDSRMTDYLDDAPMYDAAFWGVLGGVVFQGLGSKFRQVSNKLKSKDNTASEEAQEQLPWYKLDELPEIKRRVATAEANAHDFEEYQKHLKRIREGIDVYNSTSENEVKFSSTEDQALAEAKLKKEFITKMALRARQTGDYSMFREMLADKNVQKGFVESGLFDNEQHTKSKEAQEQEARQYVDAALQIADEAVAEYDKQLDQVNVAAANIDYKHLPVLGNGNIMPIEYLQIIAFNNTKNVLQLSNLADQATSVEAQISNILADKSLEQQLKVLGDFGQYSNHINLAVKAYQLAQLRADRRELVANHDKSLSAQIAIDNIDKEIKAIEDSVSDEELIYTTFLSLQYHRNAKGEMEQYMDSAGLAEAYAYRDAMITSALGNGAGIVRNIEGLDFLSDRTRTSVSDEIINQYNVLESDIKNTFKNIKSIPNLNELLQRKYALQVAQTKTATRIAITPQQVAEQAGILHNTMNNARGIAVDNSFNIIKDLYKKYGRETIMAVLRHNSNYRQSDTIYNNNISRVEKSDLQMLIDAVQVLDLTKSYNTNLLFRLESMFDILDAKAAQSEENLGSNNTTTTNTTGTNASSSAAPAPAPTNSATPTNPATPIDPAAPNPTPTTSAPSPTSSTTNSTNTEEGIQDKREFTFNNRKIVGNLLAPSPDGIAFDYALSVKDNDDGILGDTDLFNSDGVDLLNAHHVEQQPVVRYNPKTKKYTVVQKGRVVADSTNQKNNNSSTTVPAESNAPAAPTSTVSPTSPTVQPTNTTENSATETSSAPSTSTESTSPTPTPAMPIERQENPSTPVAAPVDRTTTIDDVRNVALKKAIMGFKARNNGDLNVDFEDLRAEVINSIVEDGVDRELATQGAEFAINTIKKIVEQKKAQSESKMQSSITEVILTQSEVTEFGNASNPYTKAFREAVIGMINAYAKEVGIRTINGKTYINLENMLRYVNQVSENSTMSAMMYEAVKEYLKTDEAKQTFVTTDEQSIDRQDFLKDVNKSEEERTKESEGLPFRMDISMLMNSDDQEQRDAFIEGFNEMRQGDQLSVSSDGKHLLFTDSKGRAVGTLTLPAVMSNGGYRMSVDGWITDVFYSTMGGVQSKLNDLFQDWLKLDTQDKRDLLDAICEWAFAKPSDARKEELMQAFDNNPLIQNIANQYFDQFSSTGDRLDGLAKILRYIGIAPNTSSSNAILTAVKLNNWFENIYNNYSQTMQLANSSSPVVVSQVSQGQAIRVVDKVDSSNVSNLPLASDAIAGGVDASVHKITVTDAYNAQEVYVSGVGYVPFSGTHLGNTFVMIPNGTNGPAFVQAYPCSASESGIGSEAKSIIQAVKAQFHNLLLAYQNSSSETDYNNLCNFIRQVFSYKGGNVSLFRGVMFNESPSGEWISLSIHNDKQLRIYKHSKNGGPSILASYADFTSNPEGDWSALPFAKDPSGKGKKTANNVLGKMLDSCTFNISFGYVKSDSGQNQSFGGLATWQNQKFVITVGNNSWSFDSFNDFVLNNNLVRLNTQPNANGTSNFQLRSDTQAAWAYAYIEPISQTATGTNSTREESSTESKASEKSDETVTLSINDQAKNILDKTDNIHKGAALAALVFDEKTTKALKNLGLLPKKITFDPNFNKKKGNEGINAEVNTSTGEVTVGEKWMNMFSNPASRQQAMRKLMHEQLHNQLAKDSKYVQQAQEIYDEYKAALEHLDKTWVESQAAAYGITADKYVEYLKQYLFADKNSAVGLEEFLVESLTSGDLIEALNHIQAKPYDQSAGNTSLLQKIFKFLSDLFGWNVEKGSLREKELYYLRDGFKASEANTTENKATDTQANTENVVVPDPVSENTPVDESNGNENTPTSTAAQRRARNNKFRSERTEIQQPSTKKEGYTSVVSNHQSLSNFVESLPIANRNKFMNLTENAAVELSCK